MIVSGGIVRTTAVVVGPAAARRVLLHRVTSGVPDLTVATRREHWWWRVAHRAPDGMSIPKPNELWPPAGRMATIGLGATRVIHSVWASPLAGKIDMIPGRTARILLRSERPGTRRGKCSELDAAPSGGSFRSPPLTSDPRQIGVRAGVWLLVLSWWRPPTM